MELVTTDKYIQLLNEELKKHLAYEPGMKFIAYPENATGQSISGYTFLNGLRNPGVFADVAHKVRSKYTISE